MKRRMAGRCGGRGPWGNLTGLGEYKENRVGVGDSEGGVGAWFGHTPTGGHGFTMVLSQAVNGAVRSRLRLHGDRVGLTPSRISAAIRVDQKARVLPLRIWGLRFKAKNA